MFSPKTLSIIAIFGLILIVDFVAGQHPMADKKKHMETCMKNGNLSPEEMKIIQDMKLFTEPTLSEKLKCFVACFYKEFGLVDANGMPNEAALLSFLQEMFKEKKDLVPAAMTKCNAEVTGETPCNKAYKFEMCLRKALGV